MSRIGNAPMRRYRLARPDRTGLFGRVITNGEDEVQLRCSRARKLSPVLASQGFDWHIRSLKQLERFGPHPACWVAPRAICGEGRRSLFIENGLGHNRTRGISSTKKQNVVVFRHVRQLQQEGPQHSFAAGLTPRIKALMNLPSTSGAMASASIPAVARNSRASAAR